MNHRDHLQDAIVPGEEPERYELREAPPYHFELNRRQFVTVLGAGLLISIAPVCSQAQRPSRRRPASRSLSQRIHIGEDGIVTVMTSKVEVGQGARTEITQAVAEELNLGADKVRLIMADTDHVPNDGGTFGSLTTPRTIPAVRKAVASAREMLRRVAAEKWKTDIGSVIVREGAILDSATGRTMTFGDIARDPDFARALGEDVDRGIEVKPVEQWKTLGQPMWSVSKNDIVTGAHVYPSDTKREGMLYGAVLRAPSYGARLVSVDLAPALKMEGVKAVHDGDFVGCAAPTSSAAFRAVEALSETVQWESTPQPSSRGLSKYLREHAHTGSKGQRRPRAQTAGNLNEALAAAKKIHRATYEVAYIQHVPMEPRSATAEWDGGRLTVWTATQRPFGVRSELARAFRLDRDRVRVIVPDAGGGFGGKHTGECAIEASRLAKAAGRPVKLTWTRTEEFTWAYFRPAGVIDLVAAFGDDSKLSAWDHVNINSGASAMATPYAIPNTKAEFRFCDSPLREGSYRGLASTANVFAREGFMDELASVAGVDPLEFRLRHLDDDRLRAVLEAAAERFDWSGRRARGNKANRGIGLACGTEKRSHAAACVEIEVDPDAGKIKVLQICQAFECGAILNPANLRSQVEGSIVMGLGGALTEAIEFENGKILNPAFSDYLVPRFEDIPPIDVVLVNRPDLPSVGAGETPIIAIAPAIANAYADATGGRRLRSLPLKPEVASKA